MPRRIQSKYYVGTLNNSNLTDDEFESKLQRLGVRYIFQLERSPNTGTLHYRFYLEYSTPTELSAVRLDFIGAHIERDKNPIVAEECCLKSTTRERPSSVHRLTTDPQEPLLERKWKSEITWIYGLPGNGEYRMAYEESKKQPTYWKDATQRPDGYAYQLLCVIDNIGSTWSIKDWL
ncbi:unnamed protein product [Calicophoron daubneyi]|uniref:Uncharacterized protein n=1 Tax=Calicophoron daubneyi TaxID=300641 RepID=A0AAV2T3C4_CALDB